MPRVSGMTTATLRAESTAKLARRSSPTCRADADCGSTRSSGKPHRALRNGAPSTRRNATITSATGTDRRITTFVHRYQKVCSTGLRTGSGLPNNRRPNRRTSRASSRSPSSTIAAGATTTAATAANDTTAIPAYANDFRKYIGNSTIATMDSATVIAENNTVRPAVAMVRTKADSRSAPSAISSRYLLMISSV
nr:hypothetical protein CPGR_05096 [Mycolicibacterium malmesburyense]